MVYRFGDCTLDTQQHRLQRAGQPVRLRSKVFQVLHYLLEHRDRTVLKEELCEQVWPQQFISEATLESTVRAVRQAIGDSGRAQQLIQTIYGYGYRFVAAVEVCADVPPGAAGDALRSLPTPASTPPPDDDLNAALVPLTPGSAAGDDDRRAPGMRDAGEPTPQKVAAELAPKRQAVPSPVWEQKPVAVLAVELTFPAATEGEAATYEPWTAASRWEQALVAKVQGFGGVVLQRSPSLLLVVFGIPRTLEQLPQRAVQAALALRHLVAEGAAREPCPALRQVVHRGEVLVDVQASDPGSQLRALGETLAWPVRLLGQAAPGEILLSPEMGPLVEGWCDLQAREVPLQHGQPGRTGVYAVVGNRPQWSRPEMHGVRPLSRFVGRDQELAMLGERLRQVEGGRGQVVGLIGEPGVGKSRLCYEFLRGTLAPPWVILGTQGTAYGQATPYLPIIDLLKDYFRIENRDEPPTVRDKVTAKLRGLDDTLTPTAAAFLTLLDVPVEDREWQALEAPQRRQRTLDAIKRLLVWESQGHPLLLVVENLHWIDAETQAVLDTLIESLPAARLFLLTTYRPEYGHGWGNKTSYTQLRLDPLPRESARALVNSLLGDDAALAPLKQLLIERTEGNPFYLEENVRTLVEIQTLIGELGAYRLAKPLPSIQVPATVQAVLAEQVERLANHALRGEVWDKALTYCQQAGARARDRAAFGEAVAAFEQTLQALAHLPEHGDTRVLALELRLALGGALTQLGAYRRHLTLLGEAEALARALDDRTRLGRVLTEMAQVLRTTGDHDGAIAAGRQTLELAAALGDRALQVQASHRLGQAYQAIGDFGRAAELLRRNVEAADRDSGTPSSSVLIQSQAWLAFTLSARGAFTEGRRHGEEALRLATREGRGVTPIIVRGRLGHLYLAQGDLEHAILVFEQGLALCRASGNRNTLRLIVAGLGYAYALQGRLTEGRALLEEGISESIRTGGRRAVHWAWLSEVCRLAGCGDEAWQHARQALDVARQLKDRGDEALALHQLGVVQAHADPPDAAPAEAYYQQALTLAEALGMRPLQAHCHLGLGTLYAKLGWRERARAELSAAIELYRSMEMTFWQPQAEAALAYIGR